jgi:hypothetical protein
MKKIIAIVALTLTLSVLSSAQTAATTKTICKGDAIPEGYTTVGEAQSSDCPNGAWVIKQRATPKLRLEQSADRSPRMAEENSTGVGRSREPVSTNDALEFARKAFDLLSRGNLAVEEMIDWDNLKLEGKDFGAMLRQIAASTQKDPSTFRKEIITNFGSYYKGSGDGPFTQWRIDSRNAESTTVAANSAKGEVILFTVSFKGGRQVVSALSSRK